MTGAKKSMPGDGSGTGELAGPMLSLERSELSRLSELFRLLGDSTRLSILQLLSEGERNVGKLCDLLKLPQPTVSHHLGLLRVSGLIDNRRSGKQVYYKLNGRISPAALPADNATLAATKGGDEVLEDGNGNPTDPTGMQIIGPGFAVQILAGDDNEPSDIAVN
jgi:ArsR family transcriptional regulator